MADVKEEPALSDATSTSSENQIKVVVCPATGGQFEIDIGQGDSVDDLLKKISRHLQTPRERLKVLFKEKVLTSGTLVEHNLQSGNKVTLLPAIESGFSSTVQGTQQSIIQAIESLSDVQIDDFLSGRSPLTLALRVGDHMMFVQLQLEQSAQNNSTGTLPVPNTVPVSSSAHRSSRASGGHRHRQPCASQLPGFPPHCTPTSAGIDFIPPSAFLPQPSTASPSSVLPAALSQPQSVSEFLTPTSSDIGAQQPVGALGGPTAGLLYKSATASTPTLSSPVAPLPRNIALDKATSDLDKLFGAVASSSPLANNSSSSSRSSGATQKLVKPGSAPGAPAIKTSSAGGSGSGSPQPISAASSSTCTQGVPAAQRRISTTSGKITSGVGSLSHHGSPLSGTRVVRQMQRLRRLCGSHQQCVAYSSPELASEISSIVHAAKHHSGSESGGSGSSHHRRSTKSSQRDRARPSASSSSSSSSSASSSARANAATPPASGACIDSFTTHGPGIFSGTFSGSLHPNIQDKEGRPKRDPQTILQILTDLLSATNQYQGQTGNIGMLPQLLRDHFAKQQGVATSSSTSPPPTVSTTEKQEPRPSRSQTSRTRHQPYHYHHHHHHNHPHHHHHAYQQPQHPRMTNFPPFNPYLLGAAPGLPPTYPTYPMGSVDPAALYKHYTRSGEGADLIPGAAPSHHPYRSSTRKSQYRRDEMKQAKTSSSRSPYCCNPAGSSRSRKQAPSINMTRLMQLQQENHNTREKMRQLTERMQQRRLRRQMRRDACGPYKRGSGAVDAASGSVGEHQVKERKMSTGGVVSTGGRGEDKAANSLEVQIDDLSDYAEERKAEVTHETPETVTV